MGLIGLIAVIVIVGLALYLIETYVPLAAPVKIILRVVVVLVLLLYVLNAFGVVGPAVPRLR
jgi:hypothetical protein